MSNYLVDIKNIRGYPICIQGEWSSQFHKRRLLDVRVSEETRPMGAQIDLDSNLN